MIAAPRRAALLEWYRMRRRSTIRLSFWNYLLVSPGPHIWRVYECVGRYVIPFVLFESSLKSKAINYIRIASGVELQYRCAVYRYYDKNGILLYIGHTRNWHGRHAIHERDSPWIALAARSEVQWFETKEEAREAERQAIKRERPIWNLQSTRWRFV